MYTLITQLGDMIVIIVLACLIVLAGMGIDLVAGLYKAKQRGEIRSSFGLKRTLSKFIMYEGGMLIAAGIDLLIYLGKLYDLLGLDVLVGLPFVTCLAGIFLLIVEYISIREKADEKTKTEMSRVENMAARMANREELIEIVAQAIKKSSNHHKRECDDENID